MSSSTEGVASSSQGVVLALALLAIAVSAGVGVWAKGRFDRVADAAVIDDKMLGQLTVRVTHLEEALGMELGSYYFRDSDTHARTFVGRLEALTKRVAELERR